MCSCPDRQRFRGLSGGGSSLLQMMSLRDRPAQFGCPQSDAVGHQQQVLVPIGVADHEETSAGFGGHTQQLGQDAANFFEIPVDGFFFADLAAHVVVAVAVVGWRGHGQIHARRGKRGKHRLGVAADDPLLVQHGFFPEGRVASQSRNATILARNRSTRAGTICRHDASVLTLREVVGLVVRHSREFRSEASLRAVHR